MPSKIQVRYSEPEPHQRFHISEKRPILQIKKLRLREFSDVPRVTLVSTANRGFKTKCVWHQPLNSIRKVYRNHLSTCPIPRAVSPRHHPEPPGRRKQNSVLWDFCGIFVAVSSSPGQESMDHRLLPFISFQTLNPEHRRGFPGNKDHSYLVVQPWCPAQAQNLDE